MEYKTWREQEVYIEKTPLTDAIMATHKKMLDALPEDAVRLFADELKRMERARDFARRELGWAQHVIDHLRGKEATKLAAEKSILVDNKLKLKKVKAEMVVKVHDCLESSARALDKKYPRWIRDELQILLSSVQ